MIPEPQENSRLASLFPAKLIEKKITQAVSVLPGDGLEANLRYSTSNSVSFIPLYQMFSTPEVKTKVVLYHNISRLPFQNPPDFLLQESLFSLLHSTKRITES